MDKNVEYNPKTGQTTISPDPIELVPCTDEEIEKIKDLASKGKEGILEILDSGINVADPRAKEILLNYKDQLIQIRNEARS